MTKSDALYVCYALWIIPYKPDSSKPTIFYCSMCIYQLDAIKLPAEGATRSEWLYAR